MSRHPNSSESLKTVDKETRYRAILDALDREGPMTDRAIAKYLGFSDLNSVRPRITELTERGELREIGTIKCPVTGRPVRVSAIPNGRLF